MALLTQSYVHGASSTPLIGETIGQNLRRVTAEGPERPALVTRHQNVRWSYADLLRRSEDLAVGLRKLGLEKGDRVGMWSANVSEWVVAQFGTALAGIILVNINPAYRSHEFDYAMKKSGCRALILSPGHKNNDYFASLRTCAPEIDAADRRDDRPAPAARHSGGAGAARARHPSPKCALELRRPLAAVRGPGRGLTQIGPGKGRSGRHLVGQCQRMGSGAIRHRARRDHSRQHQSRLSEP